MWCNCNEWQHLRVPTVEAQGSFDVWCAWLHVFSVIWWSQKATLDIHLLAMVVILDTVTDSALMFAAFRMFVVFVIPRLLSTTSTWLLCSYSKRRSSCFLCDFDVFLSYIPGQTLKKHYYLFQNVWDHLDGQKMDKKQPFPKKWTNDLENHSWNIGIPCFFIEAYGYPPPQGYGYGGYPPMPMPPRLWIAADTRGVVLKMMAPQKWSSVIFWMFTS